MQHGPSNIHSAGTAHPCSAANAISAAVWLAMVFSSFCLAEDTRAYIAAVFIAHSDQLAAIADDPNPVGDEDLIDLIELGDEKTVKGVFEMQITLTAPLSHVRALLRETLISRVVQSRSGSARCLRNRPATPVQCCSGS